MIRARRLATRVAVALLLVGAVTARADGPLTAVGRDLRADAGRGPVIRLCGVNLGGWLLMEGWMCPMDSSKSKAVRDDFTARAELARRFGDAEADRLIDVYEDAYLTDADLDRIAALGLNCVRLPFWYRTLQTEDGRWRPDGFRRLDWLVGHARARHLYTVLDFHGLPGGQSESDTTGRTRKPKETGDRPTYWADKADQRRTADIWRRVAEHFRGNPGVAMYDLINEPIAAPDGKVLWAAYDDLYKVVRAADPDHAISVEGCWSGTVDGRRVGWGLDAVPPPSRFGWRNVVYQTHSYERDWNNLAKQKRATADQVAAARDHRAWDVPVYVGEFNPMAQPAAWADAIAAYDAAGFSWTVWTYKATHGTGSDSWGLYVRRSKDEPPTPDLTRDTAAEIAAKWGKCATDVGYAENPMVRRAVAVRRP